MTRFARGGVSTHQRDAQDATPWEVLRSTPAKATKRKLKELDPKETKANKVHVFKSNNPITNFKVLNEKKNPENRNLKNTTVNEIGVSDIVEAKNFPVDQPAGNKNGKSNGKSMSKNFTDLDASAPLSNFKKIKKLDAEKDLKQEKILITEKTQDVDRKELKKRKQISKVAKNNTFLKSSNDTTKAKPLSSSSADCNNLTYEVSEPKKTKLSNTKALKKHKKLKNNVKKEETAEMKEIEDVEVHTKKIYNDSEKIAESNETVHKITKRPNHDKSVKRFGDIKTVKVFNNFWVPMEEGPEVKELVKKLKSQKLSNRKIFELLKLHRRRTEKRASRMSKQPCYGCRQFGHFLKDCKNYVDDGSCGDGICFKCGSTEHISRNCTKVGNKFSFAKCFICSETGHISRHCPKNQNGIYPLGGACTVCNEVSHLSSDCPLRAAKNDETENDISTGLARLSDPKTSSEYEAPGISDHFLSSSKSSGYLTVKKEIQNGKAKIVKF